MTIYPPKPQLTSKEKELIQFLAKLLLERSVFNTHGKNLPDGYVTLSDDEAERLLGLLQELTSSRQFVQSCFFVEGLFKKSGDEEIRIKEIYLSSRKKNGRTRVASTYQWAEFLSRLGIRTFRYPQKIIDPMPLEHFYEMEERLFKALNLDYRIITILTNLVRGQEAYLTNLRKGKNDRYDLNIMSILKSIQKDLEPSGKISKNLISEFDLASVAILLSNYSVLFSTRDWGVTGTISMLAGAHVSLLKQKK